MPQPKPDTQPHDPVTFARNLADAAQNCQRILQEYMLRQTEGNSAAPIDPLHLSQVYGELWSQLLRDPGKLIEKQIGLWQDYLRLWQNTATQMLGGQAEPVINPDAKDKRFKDESWQQNGVFDFIKQSYLLTARWLQHTVNDVDGLDAQTVRKLDFYTRQFVDALSPSNFLLTNPEVLRATIDSNGENLVNGLENMLEDLGRGGGNNLRISMTDRSAFEIGKNLATTPGKVIYRNDLMELLQYAPATKEVYQTPVLITPAWINKFYILDLQPENSLVRWLVEQGHTVFVISWVNPDASLSQKSFEDYMIEGPLAAMDAIEQATGETSISMMGYCLGGTLQAITLAWLKAKGQAARVKSATYLTTMIDFAEAGELSVFIDEEQLAALEGRLAEKGYLEGSDMAMTFNMLRANDLIWSFVINNYLLGKTPFPFDLLYWNSDSTRMPAAMHMYYLRHFYQQNLLVKPGGVTLAGVPIDLRTVETPSYILSTREDHIAPWKSTYAATQLYKGPVTFVLAASGHIAGVINPPGKKKYSHWVGKNPSEQPDAWLEHAQETTGSWWPHWQAWQAAYAGAKVPARQIGSGTLKPLADAPGDYALVCV